MNFTLQSLSQNTFFWEITRQWFFILSWQYYTITGQHNNLVLSLEDFHEQNNQKNRGY